MIPRTTENMISKDRSGPRARVPGLRLTGSAQATCPLHPHPALSSTKRVRWPAGEHLEARGCGPLPPLEASPGAGLAARCPDAVGPTVPQTGQGSGLGTDFTSLGNIKFTGTWHRAAVARAGEGSAQKARRGLRAVPCGFTWAGSELGFREVSSQQVTPQ